MRSLAPSTRPLWTALPPRAARADPAALSARPAPVAVRMKSRRLLSDMEILSGEVRKLTQCNLSRRNRCNRAAGNEAVDKTIFESPVGVHDVIAVDVARDLVDLLPRGRGQNLVQRLAHAE